MTTTPGHQRVSEQYGEDTAQALFDFLHFADEAAWLLEQRCKLEDRLNDRLARSIIVDLGEAANRIGRVFANDHPELHLKEIVESRNYAAHAYENVDYDLLWESIALELPDTAEQIRKLLG